jgi:hypothetical protein
MGRKKGPFSKAHKEAIAEGTRRGWETRRALMSGEAVVIAPIKTKAAEDVRIGGIRRRQRNKQDSNSFVLIESSRNSKQDSVMPKKRRSRPPSSSDSGKGN